MGERKKTTGNTRTKAKGKADTRRGRKTSNESAAASNESRNFREEMVSTIAGIEYVPVNQLCDVIIPTKNALCGQLQNNLCAFSKHQTDPLTLCANKSRLLATDSTAIFSPIC